MSETVSAVGTLLVIKHNAVIQHTLQLALHEMGYQVCVTGEI